MKQESIYNKPGPKTSLPKEETSTFAILHFPKDLREKLRRAASAKGQYIWEYTADYLRKGHP